MSLAAILGVWIVLASAPHGGTPGMSVAPCSQETPPPQPESKPEEKPPSTGDQNTPTPPPPATTEPAAPPPEQPAPAAPQTPAKAKPKASPKKPNAGSTTARKRRKRSKPAQAANGSTTPPKKVVPNGSTGDPAIQLAPNVSQQQASNQRQQTTQLLATTDANLKKASGRALSANEQEMVSQIRKYVEQANTATATGDLQTAQNLAQKAHLLSEELVKK